MGVFICLSQRAGGRQRTGGDPGQGRAVPGLFLLPPGWGWRNKGTAEQSCVGLSKALGPEQNTCIPRTGSLKTLGEPLPGPK